MSSPEPITLSLDRRILEHPRAYHLRRMRAGLWLYLDLLARLPAGAEALEVEPAVIGRAMGLPAVAHRFPSLRVYLTQDRRWKEGFWQNMFDAIALALHHQATHPPAGQVLAAHVRCLGACRCRRESSA